MNALETFVGLHFRKPTQRRSLARGLVESWCLERPETAFDTDVLALHRQAVGRLLRGCSEHVLHGLQSSPRRRVGCLKALRVGGGWFDSGLVPAVLDNLEHDQADVRLTALETLVFQRPDLVVEQCAAVLKRDGAAAARLLSLSGDQSLIRPLLAWSGFPDRRPPPYLGFLLTPEWLVPRFERDREFGEALLREYGYVEGAIEPSTIEWLRTGVWYVGPRMTSVGHDPRRLQRIRDLQWELLPAQLGLSGTVGIDASEKLDVELLLAAVRAADARQLETIRARNPFSRPTVRSSFPVCCRASAAYTRRTFVDEPLRMAESFDVPEFARGRVLVDAARVRLELDERRRVEADLEVRTRWTALRRIGRWTGGDCLPARQPITEDEHYPLAKYAVLDSAPPTAHDPALSAGANATSRLARLLGHDDVAESLATVETAFGRAPAMPAVGCEWQIPNVDRDRWLEWKQALRSLGIPSPRRPENLTMLEVAAPPSSTFHSAAVLPMLLFDWGLLDRHSGRRDARVDRG